MIGYRNFLHLLRAGAIVSVAWLAAVADNTTAHSRFAGVYLSHNVGTAMSLSLGKDGTATVTESPDGLEAKTLFGHWADSGGQVTVNFDAGAGALVEPPMVFQPGRDGLQAVSWNRTAWGKSSPPPLKKGYKVKQTYWLTQNR